MPRVVVVLLVEEVGNREHDLVAAVAVHVRHRRRAQQVRVHEHRVRVRARAGGGREPRPGEALVLPPGRARARALGRRRHAGRAFREPGEVRRRAAADALPGVAARDPAGSLRLAVRAEPRVFVVGVFVLRRVARLAAHHLAERVRVLRVRVPVAEDGESSPPPPRQLVLALRAGRGLVLRLEDALRPEQAPARRAPFPRRRPVSPVFFSPGLPEPAREAPPVVRRADVRARRGPRGPRARPHVPVPLLTRNRGTRSVCRRRVASPSRS